ncbi:Flavin-dependent L-tryptophan oxidase RebO [BD1-7 clade bacterium]|uniref:Tryptophan 2-monooxygenase n=1 Tax=BD1-7 clade bacterium TaxID=2029982 RepID=A0A5S9MZ62_9GAMM|nr:Flavin-dependent L-tryptophan oxidase RebO [BD1-7 clade bacterium]CAA0082446.1 Flavin-dependent L-tryptophan oxidase RebO [BD1-7 clade bacterium]
MFNQNCRWIKSIGVVCALTFLAGCDDDESESRTDRQQTAVVVGGGIAGLKAAMDMQAAGMKVTVLEAKDRVGGRIHTIDAAGVPVDMGYNQLPATNQAARHAVDEAREEVQSKISALAAAASMTTQARDITDAINAVGTTVVADQIALAARDKAQQVVDEAIGTGSENQTLQDVIHALLPFNPVENTGLMNVYMAALIEKPDGGDMSKLPSLVSEKTLADNLVTHHATMGMKPLVEHMARDLDVKFNMRVAKVEHTATGAVATTVDGQKFAADHVVMAVPAEVLKRHVRFEPELSAAHTEQLAKVKRGHMEKYVARFANTFWDNSKDHIVIASNDNAEVPSSPQNGRFRVFYNMNKVHPNSNMLATWAVGDAAVAAAGLSTAAVATEIAANLAKAFPAASTQPVDVKRSEWSKDPDIMAARTLVKAAEAREAGPLTRKDMGSRLCFAGSSFGGILAGSVEGAFASGAVCAAEAIEKAAQTTQQTQDASLLGNS